MPENEQQETLKLLAEAWERSPELRLGQLISLLAGESLFYMRNDELISEMAYWIEVTR